MKRPTLFSRGFTLIELLVVISIIMVLASLTMSLFRYANVKAASDRARAEIAALSLAIESYKIDNGDYPRDTASTDTLIAQNSTNATISNGTYKASSLVLYSALSGDTGLLGVTGTTSGTKNTIYFEFKPGLLYPRSPAGVKRTAPITALIDPFRNVYGYSTVGSITSPVTGQGYNPTFDLWSTADVDQKGATTEVTWIKNW
jgi:prepilin-type N-terminal cleavage/methylation domain-containing protein